MSFFFYFGCDCRLERPQQIEIVLLKNERLNHSQLSRKKFIFADFESRSEYLLQTIFNKQIIFNPYLKMQQQEVCLNFVKNETVKKKIIWVIDGIKRKVTNRLVVVWVYPWDIFAFFKFSFSFRLKRASDVWLVLLRHFKERKKNKLGHDGKIFCDHGRDFTDRIDLRVGKTFCAWLLLLLSFCSCTF